MNLNQLRNANRPAFVAWVFFSLLLCVCVAYWLTVLLAPRPPVAPAEVIADPRANVDVRTAGTLFGSDASNANAPAATVSDITVLGLASTRTRPAAILVLDGKPPRAFGVGDQIAPGIKLLEIADEQIVIQRDGSRVQLAAPARASLSVLTSGVGKSRDSSLIVPVPTSPVTSLPGSVPAAPPAMPPPGPGSGPGAMNSAGLPGAGTSYYAPPPNGQPSGIASQPPPGGLSPPQPNGPPPGASQ